MLIRLLPPVNSADGLMSSVFIQHLPVVNKASLKLHAVEQPVSYLETRCPGFEISMPFRILDFLRLPISIPDIIRPGFGRAKRLCVRVTDVGAIAGHFHCLQYLLMHFCQWTFSPICPHLWRARRAGTSQTLVKDLKVHVDTRQQTTKQQ